MAITTPNFLLDALRQYRLLDLKQLEELNSIQARFPDPKALAGELIRREWLTPYQANQLLNGKGHELVLGSYILLERLGEGGMGQVFKARHRNLGRIAAIKMIRKERLDNPNAVKRFQREVRSAAALSHPNIVLAYDADEIAGTHLMVMEYIEGAIDLAKLVKKNGPLPVERACDYVRQAALGLQHAFERGMVHRDIKPANLLLTDGGKTVKVLDMGLARLDDPTDEDGEKSTTMTQEGAVMGTPDYIAPEQALDTHNVDIRADLYSLGCAFYYLLAGRVPFPGGTLLQKLNKHQNEEPAPVEKLRPEVPPEVARVVRKLMAKKSVDRYQTPAEVAAALAALSSQSSLVPKLELGNEGKAMANASTIADGEQAAAVKEAGRETLASAFSYMEKRDDTVVFDQPQRVKAKAKNRRWLLAGAVAGPLALVCLAFIVFLVFDELAGKNLPVKEEERFVDPPIPPPKKKVTDAWLKQVAALPAEKQVEPVAAKLKEHNLAFDGTLTHKVEDGVVTELAFLTDDVTDISPLRALKGLKGLTCNGSAAGKGKLIDLSPLKEMKLTRLECQCTQVADLAPLKDMKLTTLDCAHTQVGYLTPLKDMKLTKLDCHDTDVFDLAPLKGMPLTYLRFEKTLVANLAPLKGMPLTHLACSATKVSDLSPLKDMKLTYLDCGVTQVSDLAPLKKMALTVLWCHDTKVANLSPVKELPLKELQCDFKPYRDTEILRPMTSLEKINNLPALDFWKEVDAKQAAFETWCQQVAALPATQQVEAVAKKLKEVNPAFDGNRTPKIEGGVVTELRFSTMNVTDLSPVQALAGLKVLSCGGVAWNNRGKLLDLLPLKGMKLTGLTIDNTQVSDLSPLKEMTLTALSCYATNVSDLSPLKDMKLLSLNCGGSRVSDLSPLKDVRLTSLSCNYTGVSELSPLKDMKITSLSISFTRVIDLAPLKDMSLTHLWCINTKVSSLTPLKDMKLAYLDCGDTKVSDLSPLKAMKLTSLVCYRTQVSDLSPLKGLPLRDLNFEGTDVTDLALLKGLPLTYLNCSNTKVADLAPLSEMPLTRLYCYGTRVTDLSPLSRLKLQEITFTPKNITKGRDFLRPMNSLKSIGIGWEAKDRWPAKDFWKKLDDGEFNK